MRRPQFYASTKAELRMDLELHDRESEEKHI